MKDIVIEEGSSDLASMSARDRAAEERDRQADERDVAARVRDDANGGGERSYDLVARVGGDEFVCTHAGQSIAQIEVRYASLARHLAEHSRDAKMSVGLATLRAGDSLAELVDHADQAMLSGRR